MEKDLQKLKGLNFRLTEDMKKTMTDMMVIQKILDNEELSPEQIKELQKEKERLISYFRDELQTNNPVEVAMVRAVLEARDSDKWKDGLTS